MVIIKRLKLAFQFLTIIPVSVRDDLSHEEVSRSLAVFPIVGAAQGGLLIAAALSLSSFLPVSLINALVLLLYIVTNGGLHLDGLADTFDAIACRGDRKKKLSVLKDSTTGPFGVTAVFFAILLKYLSLQEISQDGLSLIYYEVLFFMPVLSRWIMAAAIFHGRPAREEGLGFLFMKYAGARELITATILALVITGGAAIFVMGVLGHEFAFSLFVPLFPLLYIFMFLMIHAGQKLLGGMTGDTFGALSEISEVLFLLSLLSLNRPAQL